MPDPQTPTSSPRVGTRPRCPKCQSRMELQHITSACSGFEHWTLRCTKCRLIHEAQVHRENANTEVMSAIYPLSVHRRERRWAKRIESLDKFMAKLLLGPRKRCDMYSKMAVR